MRGRQHGIGKSPRSGAHLGTSPALVRSAEAESPKPAIVRGALLPTILVAIYFGSSLAVLTSFAGGLSAAYFLLPPKFSFYIDGPVHIAELGFTILLAVIA